MKKIIIDYIKGIEIDLDSPPINNLQALDYTFNGLIYLFNEVKKHEEEIKKTVYGSAQFYGVTNKEQFQILANLFHWFSISCVSYVRTVGLIDLMVKNGWKTSDISSNKETIKQHCSNYLKEVIPDIYDWRNKVAAHFAITDPKDDNLGMLEFSLLNPISFSTPHFYAGMLQWSVRGESSSMPQWSLVETFEEKIIPRYYPELKQKNT